MRIFFLVLLSFLCLSCASTKKPALTSVNILEIKPRYIETEAFKRASEYMTGREDLGNRIIIRTDKTQRDGYYLSLIHI